MYLQEWVAERLDRVELASQFRPFGIGYLDDALIGLSPRDLILIGAATGSGKTELAAHIALAASAQCRNAVFFALEADNWEIHRRLRYRQMASVWEKHFGSQREFPRFREWMAMTDPDFARLEQRLEQELHGKTMSLRILYADEKLTISKFEQKLAALGDEVDLLIIDHLHYFDLEPRESEYDGFKRIIHRIRHRALQMRRPVIVLAHLNKAGQKAVIPGLEDFHGHSDLVKVATQVITMAPAEDFQGLGMWPTNVRIAKSRDAGEVKPYVATLGFDLAENRYSQGYVLKHFVDGELARVPDQQLPPWAKHAKRQGYSRLGEG